jgi:hypothetical protein
MTSLPLNGLPVCIRSSPDRDLTRAVIQLSASCIYQTRMRASLSDREADLFYPSVQGVFSLRPILLLSFQEFLSR